MRRNNQQSPTGAAAGPMPFSGLGLTAAEVRLAAEMMAPVFRTSCAEPAVARTVRGPVVLSAGYKLLVALGREIRGR